MVDFLVGHKLLNPSQHGFLKVRSCLTNMLCFLEDITKSIDMIKQILGPCKPEVKQTAYNMLIRPKLEYSSPIWNPHTFSQVKSLERVQHSAARFVKNDYRRKTNLADLITALGWPTLE